MTVGHPIRFSGYVLQVLNEIMRAPDQGISGAALSRELNIVSGTMYPLLVRLKKAGLLRHEWEKIDPKKAGRPRQRFYFFTAAGRAQAEKLLEQFKR